MPFVCALAVAGLALFPAIGLACTIPIRTIGPVTAAKSDLQRATYRTVSRDSWRLDRSWVSTRPRLSQFVRVRGLGRFHGVTFPQQQALSLDAVGPFDNGWKFFEDDNPNTPACPLVGKIDWQPPKILVRQLKHQIRVVAVAQRTVGDRSGCILGPDFGVAECPNITRVVYRLRAPVGHRRIVFDQFP